MIAALLALCCFLFVALIILVSWVVINRRLDREEAVAKPAVKPVALDMAEGALPLHPTKPPRYVHYRPNPGRPVRTCSCHPDRPLEPGQKVLWWPLPEPDGAVRILCEETLNEAVDS